MKKSVLLSLGVVASAIAGVAAISASAVSFSETKAAVSGLTGKSGDTLYVSGISTYFVEGTADLAVYLWRDTGGKVETWIRGDRSNVWGDKFIITLPKNGDNDITWENCIITRFKPNTTLGWGDGVYNQTEDIAFSAFAGKDTLNITGYVSGTNKINHSIDGHKSVSSGDVVYLNIDSSSYWESDGAKIACYFFGLESPGTGNDAWSDFASVVGANANGNTVMKIVVPQLAGQNVSWRNAIGVRFNPDEVSGTKPSGWDGKWGQTQDYAFDSASIGNNVLDLGQVGDDIKVTGMETFSTANVADHYGRYFTNKVGCDSSGVAKPSGWATVKSAYQALPDTVQTVIEGTSASQTGSSIQKAMATYDWAISHNPTLKNSASEKYISGRTGNGASSVTTISGNSLNSSALIAGLAFVGLAAAGTMIFVAKRRKEI